LAEQDENLDVILGRLLRIAMRRRWWVLIPATIIAPCAALISFLLPNHYVSEASILVEGQQVPERYVAANTTTDVRESLLIMTDAVLSRTQLLGIIDQFGLYPKERKSLVPEQLVELMRGNIKIVPTDKGSEEKGLNTFNISFTSDDPRSAQKVTERLTTLFINENNESSEEQSTGTTKFLADQLATAEAELKQWDIRVRDFKMSYLGELPEQQQGNLAILGGLHGQLQNTMASLGRAREQQVYLQSLLSQYQDLAAAGVAVPGTAAATTNPADTIKAELAKLRDERADLLARYTPKYPDVVKIDEQIKETEALLKVATGATAQSKDETSQQNSTPPEPTERGSAIAQLKSQLEANRIETQNDLAEQKDIESRIAEYQRRLNLTPVREQQLADLLRGYDLAKKNYDDLLNKKTQSELATSLIRRQQGERFQIIDQPSFPLKPSSPARVKISLGGLAAGIAFGLALAFFVETRNHSLRDEEELRNAFSFPLLLGLPLTLTKAEERRRSRVALLGWLAGAALCLLIGATEFYVYWRS
jgi:polysaccharide chain length determinant protein (PEP-CTERM system associated)